MSVHVVAHVILFVQGKTHVVVGFEVFSEQVEREQHDCTTYSAPKTIKGIFKKYKKETVLLVIGMEQPQWWLCTVYKYFQKFFIPSEEILKNPSLKLHCKHKVKDKS